MLTKTYHFGSSVQGHLPGTKFHKGLGLKQERKTLNNKQSRNIKSTLVQNTTRLRLCYLKNLDWMILIDICKAAFQIKNPPQNLPIKIKCCGSASRWCGSGSYFSLWCGSGSYFLLWCGSRSYQLVFTILGTSIAPNEPFSLCLQIRTQLYTLMRIRIQLPKIMRVRIRPLSKKRLVREKVSHLSPWSRSAKKRTSANCHYWYLCLSFSGINHWAFFLSYVLSSTEPVPS